jgi:hypothetical protein
MNRSTYKDSKKYSFFFEFSTNYYKLYKIQPFIHKRKGKNEKEKQLCNQDSADLTI